MQHTLTTDFFLHELKHHLDFSNMYNLKYVNMHCYDKIKFDNTKDFYIALKIEEIFQHDSNNFKDFMKEYNLRFHNDFIAQCILNVFWDKNIVIMRSDMEIEKILADDRITDTRSGWPDYYSCTLFDKKLNITYERKCYNIVDIVTDNYNLTEDRELKENEIIHFIKKMNNDPIIIYKYLDHTSDGFITTSFHTCYNIQINYAPFSSYILPTYSITPSVVWHILVYQANKKRYVFDDSIGDIVDEKISKLGYLRSCNLHDGKKVYYNFNFKVQKNPTYKCYDRYCALNHIGYVKHFHKKGEFICRDEIIYDRLSVIEYSNIVELSNYKKFFDD